MNQITTYLVETVGDDGRCQCAVTITLYLDGYVDWEISTVGVEDGRAWAGGAENLFVAMAHCHDQIQESFGTVVSMGKY